MSLSNDLLTITRDHAGGRLPETENKRHSLICGLKSGRDRLRNSSNGCLRESF